MYVIHGKNKRIICLLVHCLVTRTQWAEITRESSIKCMECHTGLSVIRIINSSSIIMVKAEVTVRVKLSLCIPRRPLGKMEESLNLFLTLALHEVNGFMLWPFHSPQYVPLVTTKKEAGQAPESV